MNHPNKQTGVPTVEDSYRRNAKVEYYYCYRIVIGLEWFDRGMIRTVIEGDMLGQQILQADKQSS